MKDFKKELSFLINDDRFPILKVPPLVYDLVEFNKLPNRFENLRAPWKPVLKKTSLLGQLFGFAY